MENLPPKTPLRELSCNTTDYQHTPAPGPYYHTFPASAPAPQYQHQQSWGAASPFAVPMTAPNSYYDGLPLPPQQPTPCQPRRPSYDELVYQLQQVRQFRVTEPPPQPFQSPQQLQQVHHTGQLFPPPTPQPYHGGPVRPLQLDTGIQQVHGEEEEPTTFHDLQPRQLSFEHEHNDDGIEVVHAVDDEVELEVELEDSPFAVGDEENTDPTDAAPPPSGKKTKRKNSTTVKTAPQVKPLSDTTDSSQTTDYTLILHTQTLTM